MGQQQCHHETTHHRHHHHHHPTTSSPSYFDLAAYPFLRLPHAICCMNDIAEYTMNLVGYLVPNQQALLNKRGGGALAPVNSEVADLFEEEEVAMWMSKMKLVRLVAGEEDLQQQQQQQQQVNSSNNTTGGGDNNDENCMMMNTNVHSNNVNMMSKK